MNSGGFYKLEELKKQLQEKIRSSLTIDEAEEASLDPHSKRPPRPCGLTVHTGIGCPFKCAYCYIYDMGFKPGITEYPLTGKQLVYALTLNKYFIPGPNGTFIALGSVTEPFHPLTKEKAFEYIEAINKYLGNPVQFSTKMFLTDRDVARLKAIDPFISPLISISTITKDKLLEPGAPSVDKRLKTIETLRSHGFTPFLFLRPIIPGVTETEYRDIIDAASQHGAVGVVTGTLRITRGILEKLEECGVDTTAILRRIDKPLGKFENSVQYSVRTEDIKKEIAKYALKKGLLFLPYACMANILSHGHKCWRMKALGIEPRVKEPPEIIGVEEYLNTAEPKVKYLGFENGFIKVKVVKGDRRLIEELLKYRFKSCVRFC